MFEGEKTLVFWIGLIILGFASVGLFSIVWFDLIRSFSFMPLEYQVPLIVSRSLRLNRAVHDEIWRGKEKEIGN